MITEISANLRMTLNFKPSSYNDSCKLGRCKQGDDDDDNNGDVDNDDDDDGDDDDVESVQYAC